MKKQNGCLKITLESDLCTATGDGIEGLLDVEVAHEHGLPIIPAKRLKGCLLNAGMELRDNGLIEPGILDILFGTSGNERSGVLHIESATLYKIPGSNFNSGEDWLVTDYDNLHKAIEANKTWSPQELLALFTRSRSTTALEKSGTAKEGSLRTVRVVKKGIQFRSRIELETDQDVSCLMEAFQWCVQGFRHLGLGITRGLGEVTCELIMEAEEDTTITDMTNRIEHHFQGEQEVCLSYQIRLNEPVLLAGRKGLYEDCQDWITGSALRGAFASMMVEEQKLGCEAHKNEDFKRIFLRDGVRFGYGFLTVADTTFYPCPASIAKEKNNDQEKQEMCFDRFFEENQEIRRKEIHSLASIQKGEISLYSPYKEMRLHHSRPKDRGIGHALGDTNGLVGDTGQFFQYVSLKKGQNFQGAITGKYKDISQLLTYAHKRNNSFRLGRSRTAEYGGVEFTVLDITSTRETRDKEPLSREWVLELLTPMVLYNWETVRIEANVDLFCKLLMEKENLELKIEKRFLKFTHVGGYNSSFRLPESQKPALAPGTVLMVSADKEVSREIFEKNQFGEMTGIGFGLVKAVPLAEWSSKRQIVMTAEKKQERFMPEVLTTALNEQRFIRNTRMKALQTAAKGEINATAVEQLISLFSEISQNENSDVYKKMEEKILNITDKEKQNRILQWIKPCENQSSDFIEMYLEKEKWRIRSGGER
ncbi:MAG: hypothetical protein F8N38_03795 [Hungatella sp.]|nr:hypothetical protein [Hungatella sp.]